MEVIIEMSGLDQEESFKTILDDYIELINIGEMIQEASYYQAFNLSEQFCLQIKDTNKFIGGRSTIIKICLNQNQINPQILVFHKGLDGQMKMNKGEIIDTNFHYQPQIINKEIHNEPQIHQQAQPIFEDIIKKQNNDQQAKGIVIGGDYLTQSQYIKKLEDDINKANQVNNIDEQDQVETSNNHLNQHQSQQISYIEDYQQCEQLGIQQSLSQMEINNQQNNLQHESLIETQIKKQQRQCTLTIWWDPQEQQKYEHLFQQDKIKYKIN
ncbi:unnamed protein product [Paramecium primaurelia]|uniref:Uncharacterized protein n=1 Tax=Paramecium primaurelia TaxID=5886 RepID=A0A8S1LVW4_PARPR|nr:unnamed protein product [Paramecium primaurelia]